ncbi:uncharacterized protein LOC105254759 isoform X2 [Camponotus floridanus]|uniref:uncharacterized protein LOC105254759 isoform X2 n=1 Tax=Camponotus floridanus TaxID=104421 RepID=UPI000DC6B865|nr:uncharacterized protein LOC105254759 isoform X2 [Camponotus floridanus]
MEKFVIDLDKVLNDFEFNEDCAEQVASVATSTINVSATDKHTIECVPPKIYNINSGKSIAIDPLPSLEKHRDTRSIDADCRYSLTEKSVADSKDSINNFYTYDADDKSEQKSCVRTDTSDQMSLTIYNDISGNLIQKQQNGSNDSKDSNRYDKKLNQPSFKPSISNVFNSLNEYINAPTGSLSYVQPMLDDLPKMSMGNIMEKDFILTKDIVTNKYTIPKKKDIVDVTDKNILDCKNILPTEASTFVEVEIDNKQDNAMQNVISQNSTLIQSEKLIANSNATIFVPNTSVSKNEHDNITTSTEMFKTDINEEDLINDGIFEEIYKSIPSEQKHLDLKDQNFIDKCVFIESKESNAVLENAIKLDTSLKNSEDHNENVETTKSCNILSNMLHTIDTSDDFSEEKLNQYLLELEKEEKFKTEDILHTDDIWSLKTQDEIKENTASQCQQDDINEAPLFEKIMIDEYSKISEDDVQEKVKKFSVIDYIDVHNENITNVECNDTIKIALHENNNSDRQNELDKIIKDKDIIEAINQEIVIPENTLQSVSSAVEVKVTSKFENVKEQDNQQDNIQKLQDINKDMQLLSNNSGVVENLSDNKDYNEIQSRVYHQDISEESKDIVTLNDNKTYDSDLVPKMEIAKITDACTISYTNENNQESEKPTRPQTLDIISTHNKNDCHILGSPSATPAEQEHSNIGGIDEDRGASSDVSDNSLVECNTILGKQPPFWVPDSDAASCMLCDIKFTVLKRRHHCRACGKVLCNKCCNMKYRLEYQGNIDSRVCVPCYHLLIKAENEQGTSYNWSTNYNSYADSSDANPSQGRQPNPNNPMEYCSTIPPLQQLAGGLPPPPTVMVPVGVLKREGSKHRTEGQKSVMFSDELDTCWDLKPSYRKQGNKRMFASGSTLTDPATRKQSHPLLDNMTNSYIPHDPNLLPPNVTIHKGQITYYPSMDESVLYKTLKNECESPVMFAINRNLYAYVKIINLNCCVNKICWNVTSRGLACVGQDEVILLVEILPDETRIPRDLLIYINQLYFEAIKGNTITELGFSVYQGNNLLGSREHSGFLFIRQTLQCLQKIILPPAPFLIGLLIHRWETPWAKVFPLRLLLRLGAEYRYYPCPLVSVRFRDALYFEIGHTVMKVLADFRNFGYTLPGVRGLTIHLKNRTTDVMFPRNRYDQVIKGLYNSNDHVLAYASNFSIAADSHLVCIQTNSGDESSYQTQAINIHNKPRTVTGASFIVINGALKSSMGLSAKSSIVEDGLMVEIMSEKMEALKAALKNMQDFSIGCGRQGASEPDEIVNIKWVDNDVLFNLGVKSPIDGQLMDGIPSIRVHNGSDYRGTTRFIRWTEVFIIKSDDYSNGVNDPVDINKLSGNIAKATCAALVKLLDLLATAGLTKLGVRATIHSDNVGYEAGSEGIKLPPIYMKSLDNELIQVLHKAAQSSQDAHTVLELIFYVLDD